VHVAELPTPALVVDLDVFERNLAAMAAVHPGRRLRPHVKAHKCSAIAARQAALGHTGFTCATPREIIGMAAAGLGEDLLLANECLDPRRLRAMASLDAAVTVAVDSQETLRAAAAAGIRNVVIDVNVGLPRCGCAPDAAGRLADQARAMGIEVRGVMGYEGHLMMVTDRSEQREKVHAAMALLAEAHRDVGGEIVSAGGTGTYDLFDGTTVNEVQAGSYALMDTQYATLGLPFGHALRVEATVVSVQPKWAVCDAGLKSLGMDHGNPSIDGAAVWFCSDEHVTFSGLDGLRPGDRVALLPAHVDPTIAYHERLHVVQGDEVIDVWDVDLRGW
jgi:D-threonine aldolase